MTSDKTTPDRRKTRRHWLLVALGVGFIAIPASFWLFRIPIAEIALRQVCNDRGINCELKIDELAFNAVSLHELKLTTEGADPVTADRVSLTVEWPAWFTPVMTSVSVDAPHLIVDARGGQVRVGLLDALQTGEQTESSGFEFPPFAIENGQVTVLTDAGPLSGVVSSSGAVQREITSHVALEPAQLSLDGYELDLQGADADLVIAEGRITGQVHLDVATADLEGLALSDVRLQADLIPASDHEYAAHWTMNAGQIARQGQSAHGVASEGDVEFTFEDGVVEADALILDFVETSLSITGFSAGGLSGGQVEAQVRLTGDDDHLTGELAGTAQIALDGILSAERSVLTGALSLNRRAPLSEQGHMDGVISVSDAALDASFRQTLFNSFTLPEPFTAHAQKVQVSLTNLASGFSTGLDFEAVFNVLPFQYELTSTRPGNIQGDVRDEILRVGAIGTDPWLVLDNGHLSVRGDFQFSAPDAGINLAANRLSLAMDPEAGSLQLGTGRLHLDEVQAGGREITIDFARTDFYSDETQRSLSADGRIHFSGDAFGFDFEDADVAARIQGFDAGTGWNFRFEQGSCLNLAFDAAALPTVVFGPADMSLCAPGDLLFSQRGRGFTGGFQADVMDLPFRTGFASGELSLENPQIIWTYDRALHLEFGGDNLTVPMTLAMGEDGRDATFRSEYAVTTLDTGPRGLAVSFDLTDNEAALEDLPVDISIAEIQGSGQAGVGGLEIDYSLLGALFTDGMNEPINAFYQPLVLNGGGQLSGEGVTLDGRLRLSERSAYIGEVSAEHTFATNSGSFVLENGELTFAAGGLQLHDLSERLRGLAVNAQGALRPVARFNWQDGNVLSTGQVTIDELSFDTFRLGRLNGLSGTLNFTDLLGFRTESAQRLTLREFRFTPSIIFSGGYADVSLLGPDAFYLERAEWPFVDGRVTIDPTIWRFNSQSQLLTIQAHDWDLHTLLSLFALDDLDVAGRASGQFPIEIIDANAYLRRAHLDAIQDGVIRYNGDVGASAASANEYAGMAFDALRNFEYEVLSVGANGNLTGNLVLDLRLQGHNPDVMDGQLFMLNISIDSELADLVHAGSISASVQSTQDMITDLIRQEHESQQND